MPDLFVRFGPEKASFKLPSDWRLATLAGFDEAGSVPDAAAQARDGLRNPIDHEPLRAAAESSQKIAILIEDQTRVSPKKALLKVLLEELAAAGAGSERITIVIALGTHPPLSDEEIAGLYGAEAAGRYTFINHDCRAEDLVPIGRLAMGPEVKINRHVAEADLKIGIGSLLAHPLNGFGGGAKILFPGVADFESITAHHLRYSFRNGSGLGLVDGNPFLDEVQGMGRAGGLNLILNSVLDHNDQLHTVVCGEPTAAHRAGSEINRRLISKSFDGRSDLTIISAFPYTQGVQIMKPLAPAALVTKPGGGIILVADPTAPLPEIFIAGAEAFRLRHRTGLTAAVFGGFDENRRISEQASTEMNMALAQILMAIDDYKVVIVSRTIPAHEIGRLGAIPASTVDQAIELMKPLLDRPRVHVIPAGGVILPVVG